MIRRTANRTRLTGDQFFAEAEGFVGHGSFRIAKRLFLKSEIPREGRCTFSLRKGKDGG